MRIPIQRTTFAAAFLLAATLFTLAQTNGRKAVDERNVRAGMYFLAGDAMQGRGSGTIFERIAAEYVGSQFMQFGLEAAGEAGFDGKPTFVQTVTIKRSSFDGPPILSAGGAPFGHGKEMIVLRANGASISGPLQKLPDGARPEKGAAVLVPLPKDRVANINQYLQSFAAAGASVVMIEETEQHRAAWQNLANRRLSFTGTAASPSAVIVLSKAAAERIRGLADGTRIDLGGKTAETSQQTWNAIGKLTGSDPALGSEVILLSSHLDHVGVRENTPGDDKIFNGADDDASGTVAVIELARLFAAGGRPKRTVYFVCFGSEEAGGLGSNYFVNNLPFPKERLIANLQWEMIGRPDPKVKAEELWLTGYERSDLGTTLASKGAKIVADPHPSENFFQRSDNYALARQGIIAHTVSSFGLHTDYHRAGDEISKIDYVHMTRAINSMVEPIIWLANSDFRPKWAEGMRP